MLSSYVGTNFEISLFSFSLKVEGLSGYIQEKFEIRQERRKKALLASIDQEIKAIADNQFATKFPCDSYVRRLQVIKDIWVPLIIKKAL